MKLTEFQRSELEGLFGDIVVEYVLPAKERELLAMGVEANLVKLFGRPAPSINVRDFTAALVRAVEEHNEAPVKRAEDYDPA